MEIRINTHSLHHLLYLIQEKFQQNYLAHKEDSTLKLIEEHHTSSFCAMDLHGGLGLFYFDINLDEDLEMLFDIEQYHPLRFLYCLQGYFLNSGVSGGMQHTIRQGEYIAYACTKGQEQLIRLPAFQHIRLVGLQVIRDEYLQYKNAALPPEIEPVFRDRHAERPYLLHADTPAMMENSLKRAFEHHTRGLTGELMSESIALELLGYQLETYQRMSSSDKVLKK